jgi:hypothetical protein
MLMLGIYDGSAGGMLLDATPYLVDNIALGDDQHGYESLSATVERRLVAAFKLYARTAIAWAQAVVARPDRMGGPRRGSQRHGREAAADCASRRSAPGAV